MSVVTPPAKTTYVKGTGEPDLTGMVVRLTFSDNSTADYSVTERPLGMGLALGEYELSVGFDFETDGIVTLWCGDAMTEFTVTLIDNPVASIEVESVAIDPFYYSVDARYVTDHYIYETYSHLPTALSLKVTYTDTTSETIPCEYRNGTWYCDGYPVSFGSDQDTTPWILGDENVMFAEWLGSRAEFHVSLIENNVEALELIKAPTFIYAFDDYRWGYTESNGLYYIYEMNLDGLEFKIHYTDESSVTVTSDDLNTYSQTINGIRYYADADPVAEAGETIGYFEYMGLGLEFPITVKEAMPFTDIAYDWAYDGIEYCYSMSIMNGTSPTTFSPKMVMTRGMAVTALWNLMGRPTDAPDAGFTDVPANEWYAAAVNWAAAEGIVNGVGNNEFAPTRNISRAEMCTLFYRFAEYCGMDITILADYSSFLDADEVQDWAADGIAWAVGTNLVGGTASGDGYILMPALEATRDQAATLFMRFLYNA